MIKQLPKNPDAVKLLTEMHSQNFSAEKIRDRLEQEFGYRWNIETIRRYVRKLEPKTENPVVKLSNSTDPTLSTPHPGLNQIEKAHWFRDQFKKSHLFANLKNQFNDLEISGYLEEYGNLCCQFEDIVFSEFFQIDDFLKHRILVDRQLYLMKSLQEELTGFMKWVAENPIVEDESKDKKTQRIEKFKKISETRQDLNKTSERYDKLVSERVKIYDNLAATRKDRIEELRGGKESFFNLVASLQAFESQRNEQGKYAVLTKIASEDVKNEFRKNVELSDGTKEPLLYDETTFEDENLDA